MENNPSTWYGDSYLGVNPKSCALQQLGLGFSIVKYSLAADAHIHIQKMHPPHRTIKKQRRRLNRFAANHNLTKMYILHSTTAIIDTNSVFATDTGPRTVLANDTDRMTVDRSVAST